MTDREKTCDGRYPDCPLCGSPMRWSAILKRLICRNYGGCEASAG